MSPTGGSQDNDREDRYVLPTYAKLPFALVRGSRNEVFDDSGRRYLDLYGGHAVAVIGHSHPRWVEAISRQAGELGFYSNICYHPLRARAAELLVTRSYRSAHQVYFANSGAEANETALKIARRYTGRSRIVATVAGFHGRTIGALSVSGSDSMRSAFPDNLGGLTDFVPFGDLDALRRIDPGGVAAVIVEPVQSLAGIRVAAADYYQGLRRHCSDSGIALIFDEVQTAPGRTGTWFAGDCWGVEPDLATSAKGIAGGFPCGVVVVNEPIASTIKVGDQGSTFGGGPLAAAAVVATMEVIEDEGLLSNVARNSEQVLERLRGLAGRGLVREVRGLGYLIGIECTVPAKEVTARLRERGILAGASTDPNTVRLLPPLTVGEAEWEEFFAAFEPIALGES